MKEIVVTAPAFTTTGYGEVARNIIAGLNKNGWTIYYDDIDNWGGRNVEQIHPYHRDLLHAMTKPSSSWPADCPRLVIATPEHVLRHEGHDRLYIHTAFESNTISHAWMNLCKKTNKVMLVSQYSAEAFIKGGTSRKKIRVVPNGVNSTYYHPRMSRKKKGGPFKFGAAGTCIYRKGWDVLFDAFFKAFGPKDNVTLEVLTEPTNLMSNRIAIEDYLAMAAGKNGADDSKLRKRIHMRIIPCTLSETRDFLQSLDCFVSTHRSEGFGLWLIQAMSSGVPVVGTAHGGNCEFMNKDNSYLVPVESIEAVSGTSAFSCYTPDMTWALPSVYGAARLMKQASTHEDERKWKGKLARETARLFTWDRTVQLIEDVLFED